MPTRQVSDTRCQVVHLMGPLEMLKPVWFKAAVSCLMSHWGGVFLFLCVCIQLMCDSVYLFLHVYTRSGCLLTYSVILCSV